MELRKISSGADVPHSINVIIEIPAKSGPVKYEVDKVSGAMIVDRFMTTCMYYPCNYGYIPHTLSDDGDPCDVLVMTPSPLISGSIIACRPIGMLEMTDEAGIDTKILAVPTDKVSLAFSHMREPEDVSPAFLDSIKHFFTHYKDLEPNKWVKVNDWLGSSRAKMEIERSVKHYHETQTA